MSTAVFLTRRRHADTWRLQTGIKGPADLAEVLKRTGGSACVIDFVSSGDVDQHVETITTIVEPDLDTQPLDLVDEFAFVGPGPFLRSRLWQVRVSRRGSVSVLVLRPVFDPTNQASDTPPSSDEITGIANDLVKVAEGPVGAAGVEAFRYVIEDRFLAERRKDLAALWDKARAGFEGSGDLQFAEIQDAVWDFRLRIRNISNLCDRLALRWPEEPTYALLADLDALGQTMLSAELRDINRRTLQLIEVQDEQRAERVEERRLSETLTHRLTVASAIFLPASLLFGYFGMSHGPEKIFGYAVGGSEVQVGTIAIAVLSGLLLYRILVKGTRP